MTPISATRLQAATRSIPGTVTQRATAATSSARSPRLRTATVLTGAEGESDGDPALCLPAPDGALKSLFEDVRAPSQLTFLHCPRLERGRPALPVRSCRPCWSPHWPASRRHLREPCESGSRHEILPATGSPALVSGHASHESESLTRNRDEMVRTEAVLQCTRYPNIRFAPMLGIDQRQVELPFGNVPDRFPVHTG